MTNKDKDFMTKRLFNEFEKLNEDGVKLGEVSRMLLKGLFETYTKKGYSTRDIYSIISEEALMLACEMRLRLSMEKRKTSLQLKKASKGKP